MISIDKNGVITVRKMTNEELTKEIERLRSRARHNEASALGHAEREGYREADEKWQGIVAEKDAVLAEKDAVLAEKDAVLAEQAALIAELRSRLGEKE